MTHPPSTDYCLNCHYNLSTPRPRHCGHCGQETDVHPPSMHEFIHEWVAHYVALEGPLWRTLWALVCLPGRLTVEYFAGRRRRYVLPLRIYLTASFLFFVGLHYLPGDTHDAESTTAAQKEEQAEKRAEKEAERRKARAVEKALRAKSAASAASAEENGAAAIVASPASAASAIDSIDLSRCRKAQSDCNRVETYLSHSFDKATQKLKNLKAEDWKARMFAWSPYAMLLMQPLYAALLLLMFAGTGRRYAEHFVFSLHMHAFWFLAMGLYAAVDGAALITLAVFAHGCKAMSVVYGRGRWGSIWRGVLLSLVYLLLLSVGVGVLSLMAALAG